MRAHAGGAGAAQVGRWAGGAPLSRLRGARGRLGGVGKRAASLYKVMEIKVGE